jgi:DNA-binding MarR family transcriptional regulator
MSREFDVADRLHSAAIHLLRRLRRVDDATGLSAPQLSALSVVVFAGPISLGDLAAAEQVRPPSMTRIVNELEADGHVVREGYEADRRVVRLRATPKGKRLMQAGRSSRVKRLASWLAHLERDELADLARAVTTLERVLTVPRPETL